ncbi:hypothetical protein E8L90_11050 [Brevibacillus antibioticus]|uniref:Core-binding (CB) domain-containing protein n=1 Tax=Brevibacillus antibioticus TaxID=2570228 RepID=A0A4U2Y630_9BACL|nr:hypothetical protein [Brevibacillus antibioticus]TKI55947.1 hypothetical protein E8L90_11050 [Brevibacillus antibioticus]
MTDILISQYFSKLYLRERGKYTVVNKEDSKKVNHPDNRSDYKKDIETTTIANYVRNIKVFFNYLYLAEREIPKKTVGIIGKLKPERKVKKTLIPDEIKKVFK